MSAIYVWYTYVDKIKLDRMSILKPRKYSWNVKNAIHSKLGSVHNRYCDNTSLNMHDEKCELNKK